MGNKLCKKKSDQVDVKSPTPFDRIINRLHVSHFDGQSHFKAQLQFFLLNPFVHFLFNIHYLSIKYFNCF